MKVLMINSVCGIRSTGRICTDLAEQLQAEGHGCRIAYGRETVPPQYQAYSLRIGNEWGVRVHGLQARFFDCAGFGSKAATRRLVEQIKVYDPDIIHLHNLHGYYLDVETLFRYLKESNKPVVWTLHDCWSFTGHCPHFTVARCTKWKTGCYECPERGRYPASVWLDRSRRNFTRKKQAFTGVADLTLVTPSQWLAELTRESFLKEYPVEVIRNGIDVDVFKPTPGNIRERYHLEGKKIVLGVASAWDDRKGLGDLVKLAELLGEAYAVVVVGVTPRQKAALPEEVLVVTRTESPQELAEFYTAADVFVNPTYEDNYPTVNLEAQACGTPVITYRTGGSVESVPDDCIVPCGDIEALAERIRKGTYECRADLDSSRASMLEKYLRLYHQKIQGITQADPTEGGKDG